MQPARPKIPWLMLNLQQRDVPKACNQRRRYALLCTAQNGNLSLMFTVRVCSYSRIGSTRCVHLYPCSRSIAICVSQLEKLRRKHEVLAKKRTQAETAYRHFAIHEVEMAECAIAEKIKAARDKPQTNKRLQAIHEAHLEVLGSIKAIKKAEGEVYGEDVYTVMLITRISVHTKERAFKRTIGNTVVHLSCSVVFNLDHTPHARCFCIKFTELKEMYNKLLQENQALLATVAWCGLAQCACVDTIHDPVGWSVR